MRRHTIIIVVLWLLCIFLAGAPIAEAIQCPGLDILPRAYLPIIQSTGTTMGSFSIIRPEATTNLISNPSVELATTNYTAVGGSIARSTTKQKRGAYSLAVTPTAGTADGVYYGTVSLTTGLTYTFSVDVWAPLGIPYRIYFGSTAGAVLGTPTTFTGTGDWQRVEVTYTEVSTTTRRLYMVKNSSASTALFYVDGLQLENLAYSTSYCDGTQPGCTWSAGANISTSSRSAQERSGGKLIDLESMSAYLVSQQNTGMPSITNISTPYASIDGSFFQRSSIKERTFTIALSVAGSTTADWHIKRQALIDLIKPDLVYPNQPFMLIYTGGGKRLEIPCRYDGGMEMADGKTDIETIAIRCLAISPYWEFEGNAGSGLNVQQSLSNVNSIVKRDSSGVWSIFGTGAGGGGDTIDALAIAADGSIYAGGDFNSIGGVANTSNIGKWTNGAWTALGTGISTGVVRAIVIGPDSSVYVGGSFSGAGGVANTAGIAKWNGSAWSALGTGLGGNQIYALAMGPDGSLYAGGDFISAGGVANTVRIAKWNGSAWSALGTGAADNQVLSLAVGPDGSLYAGGQFSAMGGVANTLRIAKWNGSAWSSMGSGANAQVYALTFGVDGVLYVGGDFTTINGQSFAHVAKWNGTAWSAMGAGLNNTVSLLRADAQGFIYAGGVFTATGSLTLIESIAVWNGSSWTPLSVDFFGSPSIQSMAVFSDKSIIFGLNTSGTATLPGMTTVVNTGSVRAYPVIKIIGPSSGSSRIYEINNFTTGHTIYLDYTILAGETAILDLRPGNISFVSDFRGNLMGSILPGSVLSDFLLVPGSGGNGIGFFSGGSTVVATMTWDERCYSIDSSGV
jgi:hypothetical protein